MLLTDVNSASIKQTNNNLKMNGNSNNGGVIEKGARQPLERHAQIRVKTIDIDLKDLKDQATTSNYAVSSKQRTGSKISHISSKMKSPLTTISRPKLIHKDSKQGESDMLVVGKNSKQARETGVNIIEKAKGPKYGRDASLNREAKTKPREIERKVVPYTSSVKNSKKEKDSMTKYTTKDSITSKITSKGPPTKQPKPLNIEGRKVSSKTEVDGIETDNNNTMNQRFSNTGDNKYMDNHEFEDGDSIDHDDVIEEEEYSQQMNGKETDAMNVTQKLDNIQMHKDGRNDVILDKISLFNTNVRVDRDAEEELGPGVGLYDSLEVKRPEKWQAGGVKVEKKQPVKDVSSYIDDILYDNNNRLRPFSPPSSDIINLIDNNKTVVTHNKNNTIIMKYAHSDSDDTKQLHYDSALQCYVDISTGEYFSNK